MEHYYAYVYVRILQALGAYGFRGFYERKAHFLQSVPLRAEEPALAAKTSSCPSRCRRCSMRSGHASASDKLQASPRPPAGLTVRIFSFSFPPLHARRRIRQRRRICLRCPQPAQPRPRRAIPLAHRQGRAVIDYLDRQESVHSFSHARLAGRRQRGQLSAARLSRT
jgi:hypothetical protein